MIYSGGGFQPLTILLCPADDHVLFSACDYSLACIIPKGGRARQPENHAGNSYSQITVGESTGYEMGMRGRWATGIKAGDFKAG